MEYFDDDYFDDEKIYPLDPKKVSSLLEEDGPLASFFERYEAREPQLALTKSICRCFNEEAIGVFEAGTGVGKSLAYLLPAMMWAKQNKKRVVISTGTINLQQQLIEKDVLTAKKILGKGFQDMKACLVKGRHNFLCLRRMTQALRENDFFTEGQEELDKIKEWATETKDGSRSDLDFMPTEKVWSTVCSEPDNCPMNKCPYFSGCFVMKLKREAENSSILVANHHILFADLSVRAEGFGYQGTAVLPSYDNIIIDEAHGIEDAAQSFFSSDISRFALHKQINLLYRFRRGKQSGILSGIVSISKKAELFTEIINLLEVAAASFNILEEQALQVLQTYQSKSLAQTSSDEKEKLLSCVDNFFKNINNLNIKLENLINAADGEEDEEGYIREGLVVLRRLKKMASVMENFLNSSEFPNDVFWFEKIKTSQGEAVRFIQTPLNLAPIMRRSVFMPMATVICVSATLKIGDDFNFWLNRNGLYNFTEKKIIKDFFPSPFPYEKNVVFNIPADMPMPDENNFQDAVNETVLALLEITQGKTLILFTSYDSLQKTCEYVREHIDEKIKILKQGEADRMQLLYEFKDDLTSCLFATSSFWAGVDVPGESLSHVILVKLPFAVPTEPIFKARADLIEKSGGNSFMQLSVPEAVVQFRQGFGRLMRSNTDRGIVTVLDKRILVKRYGSIFIQSIPQTIQCFSETKAVLNKIEDFLYNN